MRENLTLQAKPGAEHEAIGRAADAFPLLCDRLSQTAGTLSWGQQQMLALTRAYVLQQRVVLLDEVSMGLAPIVIDEIFEFLRRLAADGAAHLLVEQYAARALAVADYAFILTRSRLVFAGEPAELRDADVFTPTWPSGPPETRSATTSVSSRTRARSHPVHRCRRSARGAPAR